MNEETKIKPCPFRSDVFIPDRENPYEGKLIGQSCNADCKDCPTNPVRKELDAANFRIADLEEALIKASVRADFFGDCMNNLDITTEADTAAGDPLFEEVNPVLESIADGKKRYQAHYDAAFARWKAVNAEENGK